MKIFLIFGLIFLVSCGERGDEKAVVTVKIDRSNKAWLSEINKAAAFGSDDPTTNAELHCFALVASYPDDPDNSNCTGTSSTTVASPSFASAPAYGNPVATLSLELPAGVNRTIKVIGFKSLTGTCPSSLSFTDSDKPNHSAPFIIGETTTDLTPGPQTLNINATISGATKMIQCTGPVVSFEANVCDLNPGLTGYSDLGAGTEVNPWILCNATQIESIGTDAGANSGFFNLGRNIDYSGVGTPHTRIGSSGTNFTGTFDGKNFTVSNFDVSNSTTDSYVGFFAWLNGATVKNLKLSSITIGGQQNIGGLAGLANGSATIDNISVSGSVSGINPSSSIGVIGGLIGAIANANITNVTVSANVSMLVGNSTPRPIGGILGEIQGGTNSLEKVKFTGNLTLGSGTNSGFNAGGILGEVTSTSINTISKCEVSGGTLSISLNTNTNHFGGIIGYFNGFGSNTHTINDCLVTSAMTTTAGSAITNMGGLIGYYDPGSAGTTVTVSDSYSTSSVLNTSSAGGSATGGMIGRVGTTGVRRLRNSFSTGTVSISAGTGTRDIGVVSGLTITNSFHYSGSTCSGGCGGDNTTAEGTLSNFHLSTTSPLSVWDFSSIWQTNTGTFPSLREVGSSL